MKKQTHQRHIKHLVRYSALVIASFILAVTPIVSPLTTVAAAPQDTYTWQRDFGGVKGCSSPMHPRSVALTASRIYVADQTNYSIDVFDTAGSFLFRFGSQGTGNGQFGNSDYLRVRVGSGGDVYVLDAANYRIERFDANGTYLSQFGSYGAGNGQFEDPRVLAIDSSGNLYVNDSDGSGNTRIQKFDSNGTYISQFTPKSGGTGTDVFAEGITISPSGDIYLIGATGASLLNMSYVQHYTSSGAYVSQFGGAQGAGNGQFGVYGFTMDIALDSTGNIYVLDGGNNRIQWFTAAGTYINQAGVSGSGDGQFNFGYNASGLAMDTSNDIYVTDTGNNRIQKLTSTGVYMAQFSYNTSSSTMLCRPNDVVIAPNGNIYVVDTGWDNIKVYSAGGTLLQTFGASGSGNGQLNNPRSAVFDSQGNLYIVDANNSRIEKFDDNGNYLSQFGSGGSGNGQFSYPGGIAIDSAGSIYVLDSNNYRVQKFSPNGVYISQFGSVDSACNGTATNTFCYPDSIAIDNHDNIYVGDEDSYVKKFDSNGTYLTKFGGNGSGNGQFGGWEPGITIDTNGAVYVDDNGNNRIQKFSSDGTYLSQFGATGTGNGQFSSAYGMAFDSDGNIYVTDYNNQRVSVWNAPIIPSLPQVVAVSNPTATTLKATWTAPAHVGSSPLLGYRISYRVHSATVGSTGGTLPGFGSIPLLGFGALPLSGWIAAGTVGPSITSYTITGLDPNTVYDVQVAAFNAVGFSSDTPTGQLQPVSGVGTTLGGLLANTGDSMAWVIATSVVAIGAGFTLFRIAQRVRRN